MCAACVLEPENWIFGCFLDNPTYIEGHAGPKYFGHLSEGGVRKWSNWGDWEIFVEIFEKYFGHLSEGKTGDVRK